MAAAHEERFTRKKHDPSFPAKAAAYVLAEAGIGLSELDVIAFYDKPYLKFERLLETYHAFAPRGLVSFLSAMNRLPGNCAAVPRAARAGRMAWTPDASAKPPRPVPLSH